MSYSFVALAPRCLALVNPLLTLCRRFRPWLSSRTHLGLVVFVGVVVVDRVAIRHPRDMFTAIGILIVCVDHGAVECSHISRARVVADIKVHPYSVARKINQVREIRSVERLHGGSETLACSSFAEARLNLMLYRFALSGGFPHEPVQEGDHVVEGLLEPFRQVSVPAGRVALVWMVDCICGCIDGSVYWSAGEFLPRVVLVVLARQSDTASTRARHPCALA